MQYDQVKTSGVTNMRIKVVKNIGLTVKIKSINKEQNPQLSTSNFLPTAAPKNVKIGINKQNLCSRCDRSNYKSKLPTHLCINNITADKVFNADVPFCIFVDGS